MEKLNMWTVSGLGWNQLNVDSASSLALLIRLFKAVWV